MPSKRELLMQMLAHSTGQGIEAGSKGVVASMNNQGELQRMLTGKQEDKTNKTAEQDHANQIETQRSLDAEKRAKQFLEENAAKGINASQTIDGKGGVHVQLNQPDTSAKDKAHVDKQEAAYAKGLEKYADAHGALQAIEENTNSDGTGGVLTNPKAKLKSFGPAASVLPDQGLALGEMMGAVPKGASEERKTIARFKLALGHSLTGARMNPTMQKQIQDSMGQLSSSDPDLMAKGLRGAAKLLGSEINTVGAGYNDEIKNTVHGRLGSNPMDFYKGVASDGPAGGLVPGPSPQLPASPAPPSPAAPGPAVSAPAPVSDMVSVTSPDGKLGSIPKANLGAALQRGFKQAQ